LLLCFAEIERDAVDSNVACRASEVQKQFQMRWLNRRPSTLVI